MAGEVDRCCSRSSNFDSVQLWLFHDLFNQPLIIEIVYPFLSPPDNEQHYIENANAQPHNQAHI